MVIISLFTVICYFVYVLVLMKSGIPCSLYYVVSTRNYRYCRLRSVFLIRYTVAAGRVILGASHHVTLGLSGVVFQSKKNTNCESKQDYLVNKAQSNPLLSLTVNKGMAELNI